MTAINIYQAGVRKWMEECFSPGTVSNKRERALRFLDEALELFQAMGCSQQEAQELLTYVFGRPAGEVGQEVGGVMTTLAALCCAADVNLNQAAVLELNRVNSPEIMDKIRAKRANRVVPGDYS